MDRLQHLVEGLQAAATHLQCLVNEKKTVIVNVVWRDIGLTYTTKMVTKITANVLPNQSYNS